MNKLYSIRALTFIFILIFLFTTNSVLAQTVGETLTGHYTYNDPEGDPEGISTFQWYRDNVAIPGATSMTYTTTSLDAGTTLIFEVTPVSLTGISPGTPIRSTGILITAATSTAATLPSHTTTGYFPGYGTKQTILTPQPTITVTTSPTFTTTLKPKTIHPDIKLLQSYLNTHGFPIALSGPGSLNNETNYFGPATKAAVMKFQKANKLKADGIVGELTRGKMK